MRAPYHRLIASIATTATMASYLILAMPMTSAQAQNLKPAQTNEPMPLALGVLSARAKFSSDYVINGVSLSDNGPSAIASMRWSAPEFADIAIPHFLIWGANVHNVQGGLELGYNAGITRHTQLVSLYLGTTYYHYPAQDDDDTGPNNRGDGDFLEFQLALTHHLTWSATTLFYAYSNDAFGNTGPAHTIELRTKIPLPQLWNGLALHTEIGHLDRYEAKGAGRDYWHWNIGVSQRVRQLTFALQYTDTDLGKGSCRNGTNYCAARAVFSVAYAL